MRAICPVLLLACVAGCGGPQATSTGDPVEINVTAVRRGQALHVEVTGVGRSIRPGGIFEQPDAWRVSAKTEKQPLPRLVNGSAKVTRNPVGHPRLDRWDVEVHFDTAFGFPSDARKSTIVVAAPGVRPRSFAFASL